MESVLFRTPRALSSTTALGPRVSKEHVDSLSLVPKYYLVFHMKVVTTNWM